MVELEPDHQRRLQWFNEQIGRHDSWPDPFAAEKLPILTRAKGIYKPAGIDYALSIRISAKGYSNTGPDYFPDNSWRIVYHQEVRIRKPNPERYATNAGLQKCMRDQVPVGVVKQISDASGNGYLVIGLRLVTDYENDFFVIEGPTNIGISETPASRSFEDLSPEVVSVDDRDRVLAEVLCRRGQGKFRRKLLKSYGGTCAVTGCQIEALLEAAHILPHRGTASNFIGNGLLLRADIHTLFDLGLLTIRSDDYRVQLARTLQVVCPNESGP